MNGTSGSVAFEAWWKDLGIERATWETKSIVRYAFESGYRIGRRLGRAEGDGARLAEVHEAIGLRAQRDVR